ncbi:prohead core scaffold protein and protease [Acinetobacter phage vB_AbaM_PhT2]|uniref:Prohead core scaffold protein and protease n=2 Tax=Hadassahvirus TaxID=2842716 RepID=A0A6B9T0N3_9CAUD|nr:head maturation protease [Acinetobacter phage AbTZA1]YP_009887171.1 head maturation protease [Acinetobacter phage vB_AbaM_PhT2]QQM13921.1 prohead core scaffolding protein and protease [Acinetobacter phage Maestro]QQM18675.1 prohead core scaffolding protein and protease [Acinetobacter phage Morttis]QQO96378.1 prohead protease [Acinetobacter phage Minot]QQO96627.1 prohead protease [Acinetobacter phage Mokit]QQO96882.1 prohead core scaffolding protein and protease [Acinetobacter phage Melin]
MTNEPQLLIEHWGQAAEVTDVLTNQLDESLGKGLPPGLYIEGIFLQADVVNRNRRYYPKAVLEKAVDKYIKEQVNTNQALGELNHPPRANVDPMQAAIIIEDMWWKGKNVMGRARIIEGDNGAGDKLAALIRSGWKPGVSSRGLGNVKDSGRGYNIVQEGFRLTVGVDVVWGPSAPDAWVKPMEITESVNEDATVATNQNADSAFKKLISNLSAL